MPTERPKLERPSLPKGLSCEVREGYPKPYVMRWREIGGKKKCASFGTLDLAQRFANGWEKRKETFGKVAEVVTAKEVETWKLFAAKTGGADPLEVADFWLAHRRDLGGAMKASDAISRFLAIRTTKKVHGCTVSHLELHLKRFGEHVGTKSLGEITADEIRLWLHGTRNEKGEQIGGLRVDDTGEPMGEYTLMQHFRNVRLFLKRCCLEGWLDRNPCLSVEAPEPEQGEVSVISLHDAQELFEKNKDNPYIARLALEAFGGLRFSSVQRIALADIDQTEKAITMPGPKHKTGRRHYVQGYPDNLWAWIARAPANCWTLKGRAYLDVKAGMFEKANVKNPGNVLRHSFCSYHIALNKSANRTAYLLTHRSPDMLYKHYAGKASEADAKAYFNILPP